MESFESPFDDPELQAEMKAKGVVHKPGMAADLMKELAPLLLEQGVDINNPEAASLEELNAAMSYAVERYNMENSTPVGRDLDLARATLRQVSVAVYGGNIRQAIAIIAGLPPESSETSPSAGHMSGAGLDFLDNWFSDPSAEPALRNLSLPKWPEPVRDAAREILSAARKKRAFNSYHDFIVRYRGLVVGQAVALLVGHALATKSRREKTKHSDILDKYLGDSSSGNGSQKSGHTGAAFGIGGGKQHDLRLGEFGKWLTQEELDPTSLSEVMELFEQIVDQALIVGLDVTDPCHYDRLLDWSNSIQDDDLSDEVFALLYDYLDFRVAFGKNQEAWLAARRVFDEFSWGLQASFADARQGDAEIAASVSDENDADKKVRAEALAALPIIKEIPQLLNYMGKSMAITPAGFIRRADIEPVAGMLGVRARGAAKVGIHREVDGVIHVHSAAELPECVAWWKALQEAGVIEATKTRMKPGPNSESFTDSSDFDLDVSEEVLRQFVAFIIGDRVLDIDETLVMPRDVDTVFLSVSQLTEAVKRGGVLANTKTTVVESDVPWTDMYESEILISMGIVNDGEDGLIVPEPLKTRVLDAIGLTLERLTESQIIERMQFLRGL